MVVEAETDYFGLVASEYVDDIEGKEVQHHQVVIAGESSDDVFLSVV